MVHKFIYTFILLNLTTSVSLQIQLKNSDLGTTVDDVETLIKRHEAFEKLLNSQEDKVCWSSFFSQ